MGRPWHWHTGDRGDGVFPRCPPFFPRSGYTSALRVCIPGRGGGGAPPRPSGGAEVLKGAQGGGFRVQENLSLRSLAQQNPCHFLQISKEVTQCWQMLRLRNSGRVLLFPGGRSRCSLRWFIEGSQPRGRFASVPMHCIWVPQVNWRRRTVSQCNARTPQTALRLPSIGSCHVTPPPLLLRPSGDTRESLGGRGGLAQGLGGWLC